MSTASLQPATRRRRSSGALAITALALLATLAADAARAASLDGAGRIVVVPYVVSGLQRESTIYLTNRSDRHLEVEGFYVGAEGTPLAASQFGTLTCNPTPLASGESVALTLSALCRLFTTDVENVGYLHLRVLGGFDAAPFEATSTVDVAGAGHFVVEGVPGGAFDTGRSSTERALALRVTDLVGDVGSSAPEFFAHCAVASMETPKTVFLQLQEYSTGSARPLGSLLGVSLPPFRMVVLSDVLRRAGVPNGRFENVTAEIYSLIGASAESPLIAWCSIENRPSRLEDVRRAETPSPLDRGRWRGVVRADSLFEVGPFQLGYVMPLGEKARMSVYLRHEDRVRCYLTESVVKPNHGAAAWQELRILDPDGKVAAGGSDQMDTGIFFTGPKNGRHGGVNGRWTLEISWRETTRGDYSQIPAKHQTQAFGVECLATNGLSQMLPLDAASDDF